MYKVLEVKTNANCEFIDITDKIRQVVNESAVQSGICYCFVPHTTAGITINENADPDVISDFLNQIDKVIPKNANYKHIEGNSAAHIKSSLMGFCQTVLIENRQLVLGTWQSIFLCEYDGPRNRKIIVKIIEG